MASSNRHWPSLFKSKPHHQWQHDVTAHHSSLLSPSPGNHKPSSSSTTYSSSGLTTGEERSPEPKPRWNPRPEQIRILEAIFNSGMVNPPRDEIRRIRAQLQEYGQVGDANVFYWFQNRKSRSKNKHRSSSSSSSSSARSLSTRATAAPPPPPSLPAPPTSSSSSSSERSTASDKILPMLSVLAASPNQAYLHTSEFLVEPTAVYLQGSTTQGFYVSSTPAAVAAAAAGELSGVVPAGLWTELMMGQEMCRSTAGTTVGVGVGNNNINNNKMQNPNPNPNPNPNGGGSGGGSVTATTTTAAAASSAAVTAGVNSAPLHEIVQGAGIGGGGGGGGGSEGVAKSMIFINGVAFEVGVGPVNVREAFGEEAVLIHCSGHPVLTDEWGLTLQPLQHGASYYLI